MKTILRITVILAVARAVLLSPADRDKGSIFGGQRDEALPDLHEPVNVEKEIKSCDGLARCTVLQPETQVVNAPYCIVGDAASLAVSIEQEEQSCSEVLASSDKNSYVFNDFNCSIFNIDPKFACNVSEESQSFNFAPDVSVTERTAHKNVGGDDCPIEFPVSVIKVDPSFLLDWGDYNFKKLDDTAITNAAQCMEAALGDTDAVAYMYHHTFGRCYTSETGVNFDGCKTGCTSDVFTSGFIANAKPLSAEKVYILDEYCDDTIPLGAGETITLFSHASYGCASVNDMNGVCTVNINSNGRSYLLKGKVSISYPNGCNGESDALEVLENGPTPYEFKLRKCNGNVNEVIAPNSKFDLRITNPTQHTLGFALKLTTQA